MGWIYDCSLLNCHFHPSCYILGDAEFHVTQIHSSFNPLRHSQQHSPLGHVWWYSLAAALMWLVHVCVQQLDCVYVSQRGQLLSYSENLSEALICSCFLATLRHRDV